MSIARNAGKMSVAVFLSRILGLVRELALAACFGAGMVTDAFLVAFRIPNLFRSLFAEGVLSQAFVSVFAGIDDDDTKQRLVRDTQRILSAILTLVCVIMLFAAPSVVSLMAPGFAADPEKFQLTVSLTRILSPFLYFVSFAALSMGILNSLNVFFVPALGSAAFNLANLIVGGGLAWMLWSRGVPTAMAGWAIGTTLASFAQWGIQWPALRRKGFLPLTGVLAFLKPRLVWDSLKNPLVRRVMLIMAPAIVGVASTQINVLISTIYATTLPEGSVSWLSYAYRLMHFPMGIFGVALSTATLPQLARLVKEHENFSATLVHSLSLAAVLAIGATGGLLALGHPIVALIYERGAFTALDTLQTTHAIYAYSVGLFAFVTVKILVTAFYAYGSVIIPSLMSIVAIALNLLGMSVLSKTYAHAGLALSTSLVSMFSLVVLSVILKFRYRVSVFTQPLMKTLLASLLSALVIFIPAYFYVRPYLLAVQGDGFLKRGLLLGIVVAGIGTLYLIAVSMMRPEGRELLKQVRKKLKGTI